MSEMVNNSDVEDVLFSIRRLVSDTPETKPAPQADDAKKAPALILTSALRVNDPATEPEQVDLEDMGNDLSHFRNAVGREASDVEEYPSLDDVFAGNSNDEPPRRLHLSEVMSVKPAKKDEGSAAIIDEYFEDEDTGDIAPRKWADDPDVETLGEFATPDDTFGGTADETTVEASNAVEAADTDAELVAEDWMNDAQADAENAYEEGVEETSMDDEETSMDATETAEFDATDAETVNVDDSELDEVTTETVVDADDLDVAPEDTDINAADGLADFDESILDEDALRDMVTEIVREELSGELGERITRNVRKLVRREIHRALMTREFD